MSCSCQSAQRQLALVARDLKTHYADLIDYGTDAGWDIEPSLDVFSFPVGPKQQFVSLCEVVNFLRSVLDAERLGGLRYSWLIPHVALVEQRDSIQCSDPLPVTTSDSTPILDILLNRQIETWVQPVVSLKHGTAWGFECLMRARADDGTIINPAQLLAWAKQENLIFMLDRVCRETHIENAGRLVSNRDVHMLINFLPTAIYEPTFCLRTTFAAANRCGIISERIIFEVVETEYVTDPTHLNRILNEYRRQGFGVALDDMGSGFAGLELLADLKPDLVKIDRGIVSQAIESPWHRSICRSLVLLAHDQNKLILAEGIETEAEHLLMTELDVDLAQGFYYGRPTNVETVEQIEDTVERPVAAS